MLTSNDPLVTDSSSGSALPSLPPAEKNWKIGTVRIDSPVILAPMAGITDLPFRLMVKKEGCGLVCSEMVSARGLVNRSGKTQRIMDSHPDEKPLSVQIFGSEPDVMGEAARIVEGYGADIIDINLGCSVRKILKSGSGSGLMKDYKKAEAVISAVRKSVTIPLTIKIRSGWDPSGDQALDIAKIAENNGVEALAIHPRTARQAFSGSADWSLIRRVKNHISIPVIGNGDVLSPEDGVRMMHQTGCDFVMVGRAVMSDPWLPHHIYLALQDRPVPEITPDMRKKAMITYLNASVDYLGETRACFRMRGKLGRLAKGLSGVTFFRRKITQISSQKETLEIIHSFFE